MNKFKNYALIFCAINALIHIPSQAMHSKFYRPTRTVRIVVSAATLGSLISYYRYENYVYAQDSNSQKLTDGEIFRYVINEKRRELENDSKSPLNIEYVADNKKFIDALKPYEPKSLLNDKKYAGKDPLTTIVERISEKWVGELPYQLYEFVIDLADYKNNENSSMPNRILLYGKTGLGKTCLVKAIADELELPLLSISASLFVSKYMGQTSDRIREVLLKTQNIANERNKPVILFIDEIDALASTRNQHTSPEFKGIMATLLTELEELSTNKKIYFFTATNDKKWLDDAFSNRFGGLECEIKSLSIANKTKLIKRYFAEQGITDDKLAEGFAELLGNGIYDSIGNRLRELSNREIKHIIQVAKTSKSNSCKIDKNTCNRHICFYLRQALTKMITIQEHYEKKEIDFSAWIKIRLENDNYYKKETPDFDKFLSCHNEEFRQVVNKKKEEIKAAWRCTII